MPQVLKPVDMRIDRFRRLTQQTLLAAGWWGLREVPHRSVVDTLRRTAR
jgi:hypothetical protein